MWFKKKSQLFYSFWWRYWWFNERFFHTEVSPKN